MSSCKSDHDQQTEPLDSAPSFEGAIKPSLRGGSIGCGGDGASAQWAAETR